MNYTERKELAEVIVKRCHSQGVKTGTPEMDLCLQAEVQSENAKRINGAAREKRMAAGIAAGLQNAGDSYSRAAAANRPVNCRSVRAADGAVNTVCS